MGLGLGLGVGIGLGFGVRVRLSSPPPARLAFLPVPGAEGAAPRFALKGVPLASALRARLAPFWSGTWLGG